MSTAFHFETLPPLALYVHLPWCVRKCPYCDFNSHPVREALPEEAYVEALLADLAMEHAMMAEPRTIETVFFGGGTPSLFSPAAIGRVLESADDLFGLVREAEITLEANPGTAEADRFRGFRDAGVNRLSIGVQSFADEKLAALGRIHGGAEAHAAIDLARRAGFDNFNLDLMYGLPGQTPAQALADVDAALAHEPAHLSLYQLTLEPHTAFAAKPPRLPDDETMEAIETALQAATREAGFEHYEVSAYARADRRCRHNLNYWQFGDYLGIGAGAHGKLSDRNSILRRWKVRHPNEYLRQPGTPLMIEGDARLRVEEAVFEFMLNALRLTGGFTPALFSARTGLPFEALRPRLKPALDQEWLMQGAAGIRPTEQGRWFLNDLQALFLPGNEG